MIHSFCGPSEIGRISFSLFFSTPSSRSIFCTFIVLLLIRELSQILKSGLMCLAAKAKALAISDDIGQNFIPPTLFKPAQLHLTSDLPSAVQKSRPRISLHARNYCHTIPAVLKHKTMPSQPHPRPSGFRVTFFAAIRD